MKHCIAADVNDAITYPLIGQYQFSHT